MVFFQWSSILINMSGWTISIHSSLNSSWDVPQNQLATSPFSHGFPKSTACQLFPSALATKSTAQDTTPLGRVCFLGIYSWRSSPTKPDILHHFMGIIGYNKLFLWCVGVFFSGKLIDRRTCQLAPQLGGLPVCRWESVEAWYNYRYGWW